MRTYEQAREAVLANLNDRLADDCDSVLLEEHTEKFEAGWVFYYQSARYVRTGDVRDSLVGNAPIFVPANGAALQVIRYHRPIAESVHAFVCCGDPNARANAEVRLVGWKSGASKVAAVKAIRKHCLSGLGLAKRLIDDCLAGGVVLVRTTSAPDALALVSELQDLHFFAEVIYGDASHDPEFFKGY